MPKKRTHAEYIEQVSKINPNIEVLGEYINSNTKISHRCIKHDYVWDTMPISILKGHGCPLCGTEIVRKAILKDHNWYINKLKENKRELYPLEEYKDSHTKILHKCTVCGNEWYAQPNSILNGCGCPKCAHNEPITKDMFFKRLNEINRNIELKGEYINYTTKTIFKCKIDGYEWETPPYRLLTGVGCPKCAGVLKKTQEEYEHELKQKRDDVVVEDKYINAHTPIYHRCLIHNYSWKIAPHSVLKGNKCPICARENSYNFVSHDDYCKKLNKVNPNVIPLERYKGDCTAILHKCLTHNIEWKAYPNSLLKGSGCYKCGREKRSKKITHTHEQYVESLAKVNKNVVPLEQYVHNAVKIKHKCLKCGFIWDAKPSGLLSGYGCPRCNKSKGENKILDWLISNDIRYEQQKRFDNCRHINPLPFDFYLPDYNTCIEYQGEQHYRPVEIFGGEKEYNDRVRNDNIKRKFCKDNDIRLLEIPFDKDVNEELSIFLFI